MNNAEVIKGIDMTIEGLNILRKAINEGADEAPVKTTATATAPKAVGGAKKAPAAKVTKTAPATDGQTYTSAELSGMKYNEFKKLAASLGVDCKGTRDEIMARVVALGVVTDADTPAEEKKTPAKSNKSASVGKGGIKKADAPATDQFDEQAEEIIKSTSVEDIIEALKDVGVKATKLNYKKQLAQALRDGLLDVDGEDEESAETESGEEVDITTDTYTVEYDLIEANDPDNMTEERATACAEKQGAIIASIEAEELDSETIIDFLQNNATQEELDLLGEEYTEEDLVKLYLEVTKHFIDDDGEEHEPGEAYMISEVPFCCGQPLAYDDKTNKFLCAHCANEYEAE